VTLNTIIDVVWVENSVEVIHVGYANNLVKVETMGIEDPGSSSMSSWRLPTNISNQ
jgi:hypothetical protein